MVNDMFQTELTDEEMQQVTGGTPLGGGGGASGAAYYDPNSGSFVGSAYGVTGTGSAGSFITYNAYTGAPNGTTGFSAPGSFVGPYYY